MADQNIAADTETNATTVVPLPEATTAALPDDISTAVAAPVFSLILDAKGVVTSVIKSNTAQAAPDGGSVAEVDAATYQAAKLKVGLLTWDGKTLADYVPPPAPVLPPISVSRLQGRLALSRAGLLAEAETAIANAGGEISIWYSDATVWSRNDPHVLEIAAALKPPLDSEAVDQLFLAAIAIK